MKSALYKNGDIVRVFRRPNRSEYGNSRLDWTSNRILETEVRILETHDSFLPAIVYSVVSSIDDSEHFVPETALESNGDGIFEEEKGDKNEDQESRSTGLEGKGGEDCVRHEGS